MSKSSRELTRKILTLFLAVFMCFSSMPTAVFAEGEEVIEISEETPQPITEVSDKIPDSINEFYDSPPEPEQKDVSENTLEEVVESEKDESRQISQDSPYDSSNLGTEELNDLGISSFFFDSDEPQHQEQVELFYETIDEIFSKMESLDFSVEENLVWLESNFISVETFILYSNKDNQDIDRNKNGHIFHFVDKYLSAGFDSQIRRNIDHSIKVLLDNENYDLALRLNKIRDFYYRDFYKDQEAINTFYDENREYEAPVFLSAQGKGILYETYTITNPKIIFCNLTSGALTQSVTLKKVEIDSTLCDPAFSATTITSTVTFATSDNQTNITYSGAINGKQIFAEYDAHNGGGYIRYVDSNDTCGITKYTVAANSCAVDWCKCNDGSIVKKQGNTYTGGKYPNSTWGGGACNNFDAPLGRISGGGVITINSNPVFCAEPKHYIYRCSSYVETNTPLTSRDLGRAFSEEEILKIAYWVKVNGGNAAQMCIWSLMGKGSCSLGEPSSDTSDYVHQPNIQDKELKVDFLQSAQNIDKNGKLAQTTWNTAKASGKEKYRLDFNSAQISVSRNQNTMTNRPLVPYPLRKTVTASVVEPAYSIEGTAASGTFSSYKCSYSDCSGKFQAPDHECDCQQYINKSEFEEGNIKIDKWEPDSYDVVTSYGSLTINKIDENGNRINSVYKDTNNNQLPEAYKTIKFNIVMDCADGPNKSIYCGTNADGGPADLGGNKPEGTNLHYLSRLAKDTDSSGTISNFGIDSNGTVTVNNIPKGKYYLKETETCKDNDSRCNGAWELNPNYYPFEIKGHGHAATIDNMIDSSGVNHGSTNDFYNVQFATLSLQKNLRAGDDFAGGKLANTTTDTKMPQSYQTAFGSQISFWLYIPETMVYEGQTIQHPLWNSLYDVSSSTEDGEIIVDGVKYHRVKTTDGNAEWKTKDTADKTGYFQARYLVLPRNTETNKVYDYVDVYWRESDWNGKFIETDPKLYFVKAEKNKHAAAEVTNDAFGSLEVHKWTVSGTGQNLAADEAEALTKDWKDTYGQTYNDLKSTFEVYIDETSLLWNNQKVEADGRHTTFSQNDIIYRYNYDSLSAVTATLEDGTTKTLHKVRIPQEGQGDNYKDSWTTDANGITIIKYLPAGKYYLKETETSYPYKEDEIYHDFEIKLNTRTQMKAASEAMGQTNENEIERRFSNDRYGVLEIEKWQKQTIADCSGRADIEQVQPLTPREIDDTYTDEFGERYTVINEYAIYVDDTQAAFINHINELQNGSYTLEPENIKTKHNFDLNEIQANAAVDVPSKVTVDGKELHLLKINHFDTSVNGGTTYSTDGVTWTTRNGYAVIKYLPKGNYYLKEISTNQNIFELNPNYEPFTIEWNKTTQMKNGSENNREYNNRLGIFTLTKYDEDSDNDLPRKITKSYCEQGGEDEAYCDEINQWDIVEDAWDKVDGVEKKVDQLDNMFVLLSNDPYVINYRDGMYDAGAYAAIDEDGEFQGYVTGVDEEGEAEFTTNPNAEGVLHAITLPDIRLYGDFTYHQNLTYPRIVNYSVKTDPSLGNDSPMTPSINLQLWRTDDQGEIVFKYLPAGTYYVKEHSTDIEIFTLDEAFYKVVSEFNTTKSVVSNLSIEKGEDMISEGQATSNNKLVELGERTKACRFVNAPGVKTGGLEFVKLDEEGHNAGPGHKFRIYYVNNNIENKKTALANGNEGKKDISHSYEIARTTTAKKRYLAGYYPGKIIDKDNVLFQINVHKDKSSIPGKYVYKGNGVSYSEFETDANGRIYIERLPIGTYIIQEVSARGQDDIYDLFIDNYGNAFHATDDQGKDFANAYRFTIDYKMVTCLNGSDNPKSSQTSKSVCAFASDSTYNKNKENITVGDKTVEVKPYKNTKGVFKDELSSNNQTNVTYHNAEVKTTVSFDSKYGCLAMDVPLKSKVTLKGIVNEPALEKGSLRIQKYDEYGRTSIGSDVANQIFEIYYLTEDGKENEALTTTEGQRFVTAGTYTLEQLKENYGLPTEVEERLSQFNGKLAALSIQVEDVNKNGKDSNNDHGYYVYKHWDADTVDFDYGVKNNAVYQYVTDNDGSIVIDQIPVGEYLIVEVGTTNAFLLNTQASNLVKINDGETSCIDLTNYYRNVDFEITKVDSREQNVKLNDAKYTIYDITPTSESDYDTDESDVTPDSVLFARKNSAVDLYDLLIAGGEHETLVGNRAVKYSLSNADYATVDANGILTATETGKVHVKVLGGVHSLYGNVHNRRFFVGTNVQIEPNPTTLENMFKTTVYDKRADTIVTINDGYKVQFYKDALKTQPVEIERYRVTQSEDYNQNKAGVYILTHNILSTDHVLYTFTTTVEFVDKDTSVCNYYPSSGTWLENGRICDYDREPDIKEGPEIDYDSSKVVSLIKPNVDNPGWDNTPITEHDIYIVSDNTLSSRFLVDGSGNPVNSAVIKGIKIFDLITGHVTVQVQDYANHNLTQSEGTLEVYADEGLTELVKVINLSEDAVNGMIDFTELFPGREGKLYFASKVNRDGYYIQKPSVVEVDLKPKQGFAQVKNLKHSREYLVCETETPNGYTFSASDNACRYYNTGDDANTAYMNFGKKTDTRGLEERTLIYKLFEKQNNLLFTLQTNDVAGDITKDSQTYSPLAGVQFWEDNMDRMITEDLNTQNALQLTNNTNETKTIRMANDITDCCKIKPEKRGSLNNETLDNFIFDVWEVFATYKDYADNFRYHYSPVDRVPGRYVTLKSEDGTEVTPIKQMAKYIGRYSSGSVFHQFLDDDGAPIAGKKVLVSLDDSFENIVTEIITDEDGRINQGGLGTRTVFFKLERPLKPDYNPCRTINDGSGEREICDVKPTETDYVPFADLPSEYSMVHRMALTTGSFSTDNISPASVVIIEELAEINPKNGEYSVPDDEVAYIIDLAGSGYNFKQGTFDLIITNELASRHKLRTSLTEQGTNAKVIVADDEPYTLTDTVEVEGVLAGRDYRLRGWLVRKSTGEIYIDGNGNTALVEKDFVPDDTNTEVTVDFDIVPSNITEDEDLVAYEELYSVTKKYYGEELAKVDEHKDLEDENQTITVKAPKVGTKAIETEWNDQILESKLYEGEEFALTDIVLAENIRPGRNYKVCGRIYNPQTEEFLSNAANVEYSACKSFTATSDKETINVEFNIPASELGKEGFKIVFYENLFKVSSDSEREIANHEDPTDEGQTLTVKDLVPEIHTTASNNKPLYEDNKIMSVYEYDSDILEIKDVVDMKNLKGNRNYVLYTWLVDSATETPVTDEKLRTEFSLDKSSNIQDRVEEVILKINSDDVLEDGKKLVVYEELYVVINGEEKFVADHKDPTDEGQTVVIKVEKPELGTKALDKSDSDKVIDIYNYDNDVMTIKDDLIIKNIKPNRKYVAYGTLFNKHTQEVVERLDGQKATGKLEFTVGDTRNLTVTVDIDFDTDNVNMEDGLTLVAFEDLYIIKEVDGKEVEIPVISHQDPEDEDQSVIIKHIKPNLGTLAKDKEDGDDTINIFAYDNGKFTVSDTVYIENIKPSETVEYVVEGTLYNKHTGEMVYNLDGKLAKGKTEFKADKPNMEVVVEITFDSDSVNDIDGLELVAFETLKVKKQSTPDEEPKEIEIGRHEDPEDKDQTIIIKHRIPEIHTNAVDATDLDKEFEKGLYEKDIIKAKDTVTVKNIKPGVTYTLEGYFVDKDGKEILTDGNLVPGTKEFTATAEEMKVDVEIMVPVKDYVKGDKLVAFETLYVSKEVIDEETEESEIVKIEIANHKDLEDKDQTVVIYEFPEKFKTILTFEDGKKESLPTNSLKLKDVVKYEGLQVGKKYKLKATLINKSNDKELTKGEIVFTPEKSDGEITVPLNSFDATGLYNVELVCYEEMYLVREGHEDFKVAEHKDKNDKDQTVTLLPEPVIPNEEVNTGFGQMTIWFAGLSSALFLGIIAVILKKKNLRRYN
jgi:hypothetical protein